MIPLNKRQKAFCFYLQKQQGSVTKTETFEKEGIERVNKNEVEKCWPVSEDPGPKTTSFVLPPPLFVFRFGVPKQLCGLLMCVIAMTVKATVADKSLRRALMMALLRTMLNTLTRQCGHGMRRRTGRVANMRGRRRGGSVPSMMQALQPLHGAPVVIRVVGHAANQMGVSVGVLQRVQRGSW